MLQNISLGVYYPGNSFLHRLQARTKLLMLLWFAIVLLIANQRLWHFMPYIAAILLVFTGIGVSGITFGTIWQHMRLLVLLACIGIVPTLLLPESTRGTVYTSGSVVIPSIAVEWSVYVLVLICVVYLFLRLSPIPAFRTFRHHLGFGRNRTRVLVTALLMVVLVLPLLLGNISLTNNDTLILGPVVITRDGVWTLMSIFTVFLILYALSLLVTITTTPVALVEGLTCLLKPLRWLKLPIDEFALMMLLALRFIPTLIEEAEQLIKAQTARGADFSQGGTLRQQFQGLIMLFIPLMRGILRRAAGVAIALESRGYDVEGHQTLLHEKNLGRGDYIVLCTVLLVSIWSLVAF